MSLFVVSCTTYDPTTNELNSYVLGKTLTLQKAQLLITEDIEGYQDLWEEEGEVDRYAPRSASWKASNGFTVQYELYEF